MQMHIVLIRIFYFLLLTILHYDEDVGIAHLDIETDYLEDIIFKKG